MKDSKFTGSLVIEEVQPGRKWKLITPVVYEVETLGSGRTITVPKGFETDGASIPRFLRVFIAVWGTYGRAAVIHDYLYLLLRSGVPHIEAPTQERADHIFYEAMGVLGTNRVLRRLFWLCVRVGGARYSSL